MKSRLNWKPEEDQFLKYLRVQEGIASWEEIADRLHMKIGGQVRSGKQCRQRFVNFSKYLDEKSDCTGWEVNQIEKIFENYLKLGPKWMQISKLMINRSANSVKNKFYGALRRLSRNINFAMKQKNLRYNKPLNQKSLTTILSYTINPEKEQEKQIQKLQKEILNFLVTLSQEVQYGDAVFADLGLKIRRFNDKKRFLGVNRMLERGVGVLGSEDGEKEAKVEESGEKNTEREPEEDIKEQYMHSNKNAHFSQNLHFPQLVFFNDDDIFRVTSQKFQDLDEEIQQIFNENFRSQTLAFSN